MILMQFYKLQSMVHKNIFNLLKNRVKKINLLYIFIAFIFILFQELINFSSVLAVTPHPLDPNSKLQGLPGAYEPTGTGGSETINKIFTNFLGVLTIVAGIIFIIQFALGALGWITSSGDREKVQKAQNKMTHAAIGFIAVVAAYSIAVIVGQILGINILNPGEFIETKLW